MKPSILMSTVSKLALTSRTQRRLFSFAAVLLLCGWPSALAAHIGVNSPGTGASEDVLTSVRQIHQLSTQAAAEHRALHLKGIVTALSNWPNAFFFQDATGAISIENAHPTGAFDGAAVEITGQTAPGMFAPIVEAQQVRVLGRGTMPRARRYSYSALMGGSHDSEWIELRGIVRSGEIVTVWNQRVLSLMVDIQGRVATIHISQFADGDLGRLIDAEVRLHGVCISYFNSKRQFTGIGLHLRSTNDLRVEAPPPPNPFALPVVPIREVLQFHLGEQSGHRVQVEGTLTYQNLGHTLYLQDGADGVLVETDEEIALPLGTRIRAVGFPVSGAYSPVLRDGTFRQLRGDKEDKEDTLVTPLTIRAQDFLPAGKFVIAPYDSQLVHLQGKLVEWTDHMDDESWVLRDGNKSFEAVLRHNPGVKIRPVENGSVVSVTGVFAVQVDEARQPISFRILLRNPTDFVVVKRASWWTPRHTLAVLGAVLLVTLVVALWGILLKRTVRRQTKMLRQSEERFRSQAQRDTLTGLGSRSFLHEQLGEATRQAQDAGRKVGLLMVDLDHFKKVNDTLGHDAGDKLLCLVAERMRASVRKHDLVARTGGDEFVILLQDIKDYGEAKVIGAKIVDNISQPALIGDNRLLVSASIGVCLYPDDGADADALLQNADAAMYQSKAAGRNRLSVFAESRSPQTRHHTLEHRLNLDLQPGHNPASSVPRVYGQRRSEPGTAPRSDQQRQEKEITRGQLLTDLKWVLRDEQFLLHFQPQVDQQGRWIGAEALLRWQHPRLGLLLPGTFLPLAEQDGMMEAIGQWVIEESCDTLKRWSTTEHLSHLTLAVNVSALQFRHPQFATRLEATVDRFEINPQRLMLEFTEGFLFSPLEETRIKMQGLRAHGIRFAIDDFGCGYSSLTYLQSLPLDQLKIDRSFIRNILENPNDAVIVRSILALGQNLGLEVIAEGIETREQFEVLASQGCARYQGFLFGRPVPASELQEQGKALADLDVVKQ